MLPQWTYSDECMILKTGWRLSAHTSVNTLTLFTEVLPAHVPASTTNMKGTTIILKMLPVLQVYHVWMLQIQPDKSHHLSLWNPWHSHLITHPSPRQSAFGAKQRQKQMRTERSGIKCTSMTQNEQGRVAQNEKRSQPEEGSSRRASVHRSALKIIRLELDTAGMAPCGPVTNLPHFWGI